MIQHLRAAVLITLILSFCAVVKAQQPQPSADQKTTSGVDLYRQGDTVKAIKVLSAVVKKHPEDAEAWYYLGLAQFSLGRIAGSRTAFEKTIELRPSSADAHAKLAYALILGNEPNPAIAFATRALELGDRSPEAHYALAESNLRTGKYAESLAEASEALAVKPDFLLSLITQSFANYSLHKYSAAADSLERVLAIRPDDVDAEIWRAQVKELRSLASQPSSISVVPLPLTQGTNQPLAFKPKEVTTKARVFQKPEPGYTEAARLAGVTGTVIIKCIFSSDRQIKNLVVVRALGFGLTSKSISAAQAIRFEPATKDGRLVSQYVQLEYAFSLY